MKKQECSIFSFTYLKVREGGEGIRVGQKEHMQQIWIQCRVGSTLRGMSGVNKVLDITGSQEVKKTLKKVVSLICTVSLTQTEKKALGPKGCSGLLTFQAS